MSESSEQPDSPPQTVGETAAWDSSGATETAGGTRDLTGKTLGDFEVERLLGRGGMGEVYLARQISLNRPVALKVLRTDMLNNPTYLSRFEAEATAVARLNHPNIVHVYMLGCVDNIRFIAMEYVQGTNLREFLIKKGALDLPLALSIMKQTGVAIGAAGEIGLIHRDIKPENLLLTRKGQVKVADFGLCRDSDADKIHLTQPGVTMGTPQYMSPEQAQGHALDHRSDLYSLGVTAYHMLTGTPPFRAETALAVALKHVKDTAVRPIVHRPEIPAELERLVMKLMEKKPKDRYQSAAEMLRDLAKIRDSLQATTATIPDADLAGVGNGTSTPTSTAVAAPASKPSRTQAAARPKGPGLGARLSAVRLSTGQTTGLISACLAIGLVWGWLTREPDLISESTPQRATMPALWMVPEWKDVLKQNSPEAQYRYAQLHVAKTDQEGAWLAVPGNFPSSREWASKAYIQLARELLRRQDTDRLRAFAAELRRWHSDRMHEQELAIIVQAAVDALDGKVEDVIAGLGPKNLDPKTVIDPALLELSLEVTAQAANSRDGESVRVPQGLREIQANLLQRLYNVELREPLGRSRLG
ncbi:protein kinase domain-containing protein [Singulisphaera acidiphila]|uniref:non-specific serine/threonine protein kinase n=1 Tax=Singulisphaera acidiphila (strain ATCC BAA-1392 / DSM 18658 / VKM B-2454 / MOB10) TaxID=886293 RepID=L0DG30_SINAD|nr:protein kinase [Singulisphaera acidiphila]AGA27805.1 serine/threonine protein kinase [Singulisphaera acidiphila DSM 18658]